VLAFHQQQYSALSLRLLQEYFGLGGRGACACMRNP
jgi:hypothetical protein